MVALLGASAPRITEACEIVCAYDRRPEALFGYKYLFLGKTIAASRDASRNTFVLEPVRVWKGGWAGDKDRFHVTTSDVPMCGYPLVLGAYYIVGASEEPQKIGQCDHEPIPLAGAQRVAAALDRARGLPRLALADAAWLSPEQLRCPPDSWDAYVDECIEQAALIVVGKLVSVDASPDADWDAPATARLKVKRAIKGQARGSLPVRIDRWHASAITPRDGGVWFLGKAGPGGVAGMQARVPLDLEARVRSRFERWRILGRGCPTTN